MKNNLHPHVKPLLNTITQGDCVKLLERMPNDCVDFVLADPPYVARYTASDGRIVPNDRHVWLRSGMAAIYRVLRPDRFAVITYSWAHGEKYLSAFRDAGFRFAGHLVFRKRYTSAVRYLAYQHDVAYLLAKGSPPIPEDPLSDVRDWDFTGNKLHPTQQPLSVLLPLIAAYSHPNDVVLDPFCGSGSALVAARRLGRNFIGFDIDPVYARIAAARLSAHLRDASASADHGSLDANQRIRA